jgi:hypothetical protein
MGVYFVTCREANAVKIGHSGEPRLRVKEIQWGCPLPVVLEAVVPGGYEEEARLHGQFEQDRLTGEWFRLNPVIEQMIADNPPPAPIERVGNPYYRPPRTSRTQVARVRAHLRITIPEMAGLIGIDPTILRRLEWGFGKWREPPPEVREKLNELAPEVA